MITKRIVIKVGTSSLTYANGRLKLNQIERLVRDISDLVNQNHQVILVSSGAIGAGMSKLGLSERPQTIPEKQATAAIGQGFLMQVYSKMFAEYSHICAQVLLTAEDLQQRQRYLNCRNTLETLLGKNVIPIVNENDSVSIDEINFGDNDTLSAMVANLVSADLAIILSDIDGLFTKNPQEEGAELIEEVHEITESTYRFASGTSGLGTGGMITKLNAGKICQMSGIPMVIANASTPNVIQDIVAGKGVGTLFVAQKCKLTSRKRWIAFANHPQGKIVVDHGAIQALTEGKSLLPAGIVACIGDFRAGDLVEIYNEANHKLAKGLTTYSATEINIIKGKSSSEISKLLQTYQADEVIHRDNLVMVENNTEGGIG